MTKDQKERLEKFQKAGQKMLQSFNGDIKDGNMAIINLASLRPEICGVILLHSHAVDSDKLQNIAKIMFDQFHNRITQI